MKTFAKVVSAENNQREKLCRVRRALCKLAARRKILWAKWRRAGRHVQGVVILAAARDARRVGGRQARAATSVATVTSLLHEHRARRRPTEDGPPPTLQARFVRAAAAGPVLHLMVASYERRGDG